MEREERIGINRGLPTMYEIYSVKSIAYCNMAIDIVELFSFVKFLSCMDNATSYQTACSGVIDNAMSYQTACCGVIDNATSYETACCGVIDNATSYQTACCGVIDNVAILLIRRPAVV